jgi:predicted MFS family arabinose efflux permease
VSSTDHPAPRRHGAPIQAIAVAETLFWAGTFYAAPALLLHWETEEGWSRAELTGAFTLALLAAALGGPIAGRLIDRGHGRAVLSLSGLAAGTIMGAIGFVDELRIFQALWILLGVCMAGCLYEPCFAFLTRVRGVHARRGITIVTLYAGFASTLSFPLAEVIASQFGWRAATGAFAALILFVAVPLTWWGAGREAAEADAEPASHDTDGVALPGVRAVLARPAFWLLAVAFAGVMLEHAMVVSHIRPLLAERGIAIGTAVFAASLVGPMQVLGRLALLAVEARVASLTVGFLSMGGMALGAAALYAAGIDPALLAVYVVAQGAGVGVFTLIKPVLTAELLGRRHFGTISGLLAVPFTGAAALAPGIGTLLWQAGGGYATMILAGLALALAGIALLALASRAARRG